MIRRHQNNLATYVGAHRYLSISIAAIPQTIFAPVSVVPEPEPTPGTGGTTRQDHQYRPRLPRRHKDEEPTFREIKPHKKTEEKPRPIIDLDRYGVFKKLPPTPPQIVVTPKSLSVDVKVVAPEIQNYYIIFPSSLELTPALFVPEIIVGPVTLSPQTISVGINQEKASIAEDDEEIMFILGILRNRE